MLALKAECQGDQPGTGLRMDGLNRQGWSLARLGKRYGFDDQTIQTRLIETIPSAPLPVYLPQVSPGRVQASGDDG